MKLLKKLRLVPKKYEDAKAKSKKNDTSIASLESQVEKLQKEIGDLQQKNVQLRMDLQGWRHIASEDEGELTRIKGDLKGS